MTASGQVACGWLIASCTVTYHPNTWTLRHPNTLVSVILAPIKPHSRGWGQKTMLTTLVGLPVSELDTPALLVDIEAMDRNIAHIAGTMRTHGVQWRPHAKGHKPRSRRWPRPPSGGG